MTPIHFPDGTQQKNLSLHSVDFIGADVASGVKMVSARFFVPAGVRYFAVMMVAKLLSFLIRGLRVEITISLSGADADQLSGSVSGFSVGKRF